MEVLCSSNSCCIGGFSKWRTPNHSTYSLKWQNTWKTHRFGDLAFFHFLEALELEINKSEVRLPSLALVSLIFQKPSDFSIFWSKLFTENAAAVCPIQCFLESTSQTHRKITLMFVSVVSVSISFNQFHVNQWIGLLEKWHRRHRTPPIFHGTYHGFWLRLSPEPGDFLDHRLPSVPWREPCRKLGL